MFFVIKKGGLGGQLRFKTEGVPSLSGKPVENNSAVKTSIQKVFLDFGVTWKDFDCTSSRSERPSPEVQRWEKAIRLLITTTSTSN